MGLIARSISSVRARVLGGVQAALDTGISTVKRGFGPQGAMARTWSSGASILWVALLLCAFLLLFYTR